MSFISSLLTSQSPLAFLLVILLPSIPTLIAQFRRWRQSHNHQHDPRPRRPYQLIALLSFHTLYQAIQLFRPSYNVFHSHGIPITVDVPTVRRALSRYYASSSHDSAEYERLLNRLSNLDYRLIYARFGHRPIAECGWCTSFDDFALVASPSVIAPYAISGVLLGVLGWKMVSGAEGPERAEKLRGTFGWFVGVLAVGDVVGRYVWDMRVVEGYCVQVCSLLHPSEENLAFACMISQSRLPGALVLPADLLPARRAPSSSPETPPPPLSPHLHSPPSHSITRILHSTLYPFSHPLISRYPHHCPRANSHRVGPHLTGPVDKHR